jgi:hypothetical protein
MPVDHLVGSRRMFPHNHMPYTLVSGQKSCSSNRLVYFPGVEPSLYYYRWSWVLWVVLVNSIFFPNTPGELLTALKLKINLELPLEVRIRSYLTQEIEGIQLRRGEPPY